MSNNIAARGIMGSDIAARVGKPPKAEGASCDD